MMTSPNLSVKFKTPSLEVPAQEFRRAMRELAGSVAVVTVGDEKDRSGFVATSVASFSAEPPRLIVCINRASSSWEVLSRRGQFGVNLMREDEVEIANRFIGIGGIKGNERYGGAEWITLPSGTQVLKDAIVSIECSVEESLDRHDHAIVLGKVESIRVCDHGNPLLWYKSGYYHLGGPVERSGL
jgi:flavin reductase (DIM6/NTAB) family NADH-FMN oxidoreductase RutF